VLADKSRTKLTRNTKIGRKVVHLTGNNVHQFHGQRSKVKSPGNKIIAHTVYTQCLGTGEAYKLQTWYIDGARRPVSTSSAVTSKVKGQGRKVTRSRDASDRCWPVGRERNVLETPKLVGRCNNVHQFQGQRSRLPGRLMLTEYMPNLPNGKAYELQTWYTYGARRPVSATSAVTSKVKGQGRKVT